MPPKKKLQHQTRMHGAYDHLGPNGMGFPKSLIFRKVRSLLKVYGDEGWRFLEDNSYRVLLEAILEEQDKPPQVKKICPMGDETASTSNQQPNQVVKTEHACTEPEPKRVPKLELEFDMQPDILGLPLPSTPFQEPVASPPRQKRKPCYGWISSDNEELDLVSLETEFSMLRQNCGRDCRKRKNRWDVKPEGM